MKILVFNGSPKKGKERHAPNDAPVTVPRLDLIKRAGKEYAEKGEIDAALLSEICSPMIPEEEYARIANGTC